MRRNVNQQAAGEEGGQRMRNRRSWAIVILVVVFVGLSVAACALLWRAAGTASAPTVGFGDAVGVIPVEGVIASGFPDSLTSTSGTVYSGRVIEYLQQAEADHSVKAIVMRVDSPGGGVVGSDEIHQQMLAMTKPVVVSMGEMAASGGYFISAPADEIMANRNTLTGSIGVISQFISLEEFLEKNGISATTIVSGEFKASGSMFEEMSAEDQAIWQAIIDDAFEDFVGVVVEGRGMSEAEVLELADGRVFTGEQAQQAGLVDSLGNLPDAISRAAELGGIEGEPRIVEYRPPPGFLESLLGMQGRAVPGEALLRQLLNEGRPVLMYLYTGG
jgi:protease IV